jgi:hypothetical protein
MYQKSDGSAEYGFDMMNTGKSGGNPETENRKQEDLQ